MSRSGSKPRRSVPAVMAYVIIALAAEFCVPCGWAKSLHLTPQVTESTLDSIPLGNSIISWFPVDCEGDNVWELGVAVAGVPSTVGVLSVSDGIWHSGPFELAIDGFNWGAGNYDADATIEYAYLSVDSIRRFDPDDASDVALWSTSFVPSQALFFGQSPQGGPIVSLLKFVHFDTLIPWPPFDLYQSYDRWHLHRVSLTSGVFIDSIPAGPSIRTSLYHPSSSRSVSLTIGHLSSFVHDQFFYRESTTYSIKSMSEQWETLEPSVGRTYGCGPCYYVPPHRESVRQNAIGRATSADPVYRIIEIDTGASWPGMSPTLRGYSEDSQVASWAISWPNLTQGGRYRAFAIADPDGDGICRCYMPVRDSSIWEIRDIASGAELGRLYSVPDVDLYAGPLFVAGTPDLFYFTDSVLYFFRPESPTGVFDDSDELVNLPSDIVVAAVPNPFNSATRISWPEGVVARSLMIYNVLGQAVTEITVNGKTSATWDGCDSQSHECPSGIYIAQVASRDFTASTKIVLLR